MESGKRTASSLEHVSGIDSLRFICALCVFFGHGAAPPVENLFPLGSVPRLACHLVSGVIWNGPAAVVVFFVISGFCIHFPFADAARRLNLAEFYSRRFLRLLVPMAVAMIIAHGVGLRMTLFQVSILWSLLAELIYYLLYPLLRWLRQRAGSWTLLVIGSYLVYLALVVTHPLIVEYALYSPWVIWLLGLPSWLLGCVLAESVRRRELPAVSWISMWSLRGAVVAAVCVCSALRFHTRVGLPWTFAPFALLVAAWLQKEIAYHRNAPAWRLLEWGGKWSYSLYLLHTVVIEVFRKRLPGGSGPSNWLAVCLTTFAACYLFYLLVEKPGHALARRVSRWFRRIPAPIPGSLALAPERD